MTNANDMTQTLKLFDKNLKATITETLQEVRVCTLLKPMERQKVSAKKQDT